MNKSLTLLIFYIILSFELNAQQIEFSTFFALEDAAGHRDTIWFEANENGNDKEIDIEFGEIEVIQPVDSSLFFVTTPVFNTNDILISNKIVNSTDTYYNIGFILIFINAEFPVKVTMDRTFLDEFDYRFTNYFMTYCQYPFLMDWPLMWYDAEGFECLLNEPIYIQNPQFKKSEYSCNDHYIYDIDIKGKGIQTVYGVEIATIKLDDYCYSKLETDQNITKEDLIISPNPAADRLSVRLNSGYQIQYFITDISGRTVQKGRTEYQDTVEINQLQPGIYIISMVDNHYNIYRQKFVKN